MPSTFRARRRTRGSPWGSGASSASTEVPSARASGPRWSTARRRLPFSNRLSVDGAMPAAFATVSSDSPRSSRSARRRRRIRSSFVANSARKVARTGVRVQPSDAWTRTWSSSVVEARAFRSRSRSAGCGSRWSSWTPGSPATRPRTRSAACSARTTSRRQPSWPPAARSSPSCPRSG